MQPRLENSPPELDPQKALFKGSTRVVAPEENPTRHVLGTDGLPKYVHHPVFERSCVTRRILDGIEADLATSGPPNFDAEQRLFRAMHYCAFKAASRRGRKHTMTAASRRWVLRRRRIRDHLITANLGLVFDMLHRSHFGSVDPDDLLSEGLRALIDAVEAFDPWRGFRFSTYACNAIHRGFIKVAKSDDKRLSRVDRTFDLECLSGRGGDDLDDWDHAVYSERLPTIMHQNAANLSWIERYVISKRFPDRSDRPAATLAGIGREIQLSKERVRQIQCGALEKLRRCLLAEPVLA